MNPKSPRPYKETPTDLFKSDLGPNLRAARERARLSQEQAAECADVGVKTYQKYEYGKVNAPGSKLLRLATAFKCSIDWLCRQRKAKR